MITILHTNDIHGHLTSWRGWTDDLDGKEVGGLDRLASAIADIRGEGSPVLLLDAGDLIGDTMIAQLTRGGALLRVFHELGYDALTLGNHEPDFGSEVLKERIAAAEFPVLASNVVQKKNGELLARPYVVKELAGVRVGILGVAYPKTPWTTAPKNVADLQFLDPAQTAREQVRELHKAGADVVVALVGHSIVAVATDNDVDLRHLPVAEWRLRIRRLARKRDRPLFLYVAIPLSQNISDSLGVAFVFDHVAAQQHFIDLYKVRPEQFRVRCRFYRRSKSRKEVNDAEIGRVFL